MPGTSVSATYFQSAFETCVRQGCDAETLLRELQIDPIQLHNPVNRVSGDTFLALLHLAEELLGKPGIGIEIGRSFRPETFRDIGYVAISCENIIDALNLNTKYQRLTQDIGKTWIEVDGDTAAINWKPYRGDDDYIRPMTDLVYAGYYTVGLWMAWIAVGSVFSLARFRCAEMPYAAEFGKIFGCDLEFNAPCNALVFDASVARTPFPQHNPELVAIISKRLDRALANLDNDSNCKDRVYDAIEALLPRTGVPKIKTIASIMGTSERTLRRRLIGEGLNYRQLVEQVRKDSCEIHLKDHNVSVSQIAQKLGFADQSSFAHAFKAWHGCSVSAYMQAGMTDKQS